MAEVTSRPFLSYLDGTPHKQCLFIILYPVRDSATICCVSQPRSYIRPTARSSWWGNALGFPKPQFHGITMTIVDSYCDVTMTIIRLRLNQNSGAASKISAGGEFGVARKLPIISGNSRARSCADGEDRGHVTRFSTLVNSTYFLIINVCSACFSHQWWYISNS